MKKLAALIIGFCLLMVLVGCSSQPPSGNTNNDKAAPIDLGAINTDTTAKTVSIYAQVNGTYFTENTRHAIVSTDGANAEKSILRTSCSEKDFYGALIAIGAQPGDNLKLPMENGQFIEGDKLEVSVSGDSIDGEVPFDQCVKTGDGKPYVMDATFGGNIKNAYALKTGCILCLDSCPVGIVSSATYPTGTVEGAKTQQFYGNADVLPADGSTVKVTFTLKAA